MLRFYSAFAIISFFLNVDLYACGFNFVGDCSTSISLKINGTQDSFAVAPCPGALKFDGFALGYLQSLSIARAKAITWESCQNNVSGMALYYRVFEQGIPGGIWQNIDLQEDYNNVVGPYTTRYRSVNTDKNLTNGLVTGKTYVLEIYFRAEVDTLGDDFIPETVLLQNNNGQNYHFTFQYGGASAPPFVVATTKIVPVKCHGDSTGVAGVSVYGNQGGLFYQWSTGGNNYWILSEIPAGTYSVTVSGAGGYSASDTMEITQPELLTKTMEAEICFGETYTLSGEYFTEAGNYTVEIEGFPNCDTTVYLNLKVLDPAIALQDMPATGAVTCALPAFDLCAGPMANTAFQWFQNDIPTATTPCLFITTGGNYEIVATMTGAFTTCSAAAAVGVEEHFFLPPPQVYGEVTEPVICSPDDTLHLLFRVTTTAEEPVFQWVLDGDVLSVADSCMIEIPGISAPFDIPSVTVTDKYGCSITQEEASIVITQPFPILLHPEVTDASGPGAGDGAIQLDIFGMYPPYEVTWDNGDTGIFIENLVPDTYCAVVTDANGCTASICATVFYTNNISELPASELIIFPNPAMAGQAVAIALPENFKGEDIVVEILDLWGRSLLRQTTTFHQMTALVVLPEPLPAGAVIVRLADSGGDNAIGRITIH